MSTRCVSWALHVRVSGFKHGMASPPPPRPLKTLHYETPVPLFARSRLSEFNAGERGPRCGVRGIGYGLDGEDPMPDPEL